MTVTVKPAPARTDVTTTRVPAARTGAFVAAGAAIWAGAMALYSPQDTGSLAMTVNDLGALPFQASLFALVTLQLRTGATGSSRFARGMLKFEYGLLTLATLWTVLHGLVPAFRDDAWLKVLDMFWPLSMLGMAIIGTKIALTGRWKGAARIWPAIAESWAIVTVPVMGALGATAGQFTGVGHLLIGYVILGLIIAFRPHLTAAR